MHCSLCRKVTDPIILSNINCMIKGLTEQKQKFLAGKAANIYVLQILSDFCFKNVHKIIFFFLQNIIHTHPLPNAELKDLKTTVRLGFYDRRDPSCVSNASPCLSVGTYSEPPICSPEYINTDVTHVNMNGE